jgi:hypothetical protein
MSSWFCKINDKVYGPLSAAELKEWIASHKLAKSDYVRQGENGAFVSASKIKNCDWPDDIVDPLLFVNDIHEKEYQPQTRSDKLAKPILATSLLAIVLIVCLYYYLSSNAINDKVEEHTFIKLQIGMLESQVDEILGLPNSKGYGKKVIYDESPSAIARDQIVRCDSGPFALNTYKGRRAEEIKILFNNHHQIVAMQYSVDDIPVFCYSDALTTESPGNFPSFSKAFFADGEHSRLEILQNFFQSVYQPAMVADVKSVASAESPPEPSVESKTEEIPIPVETQEVDPEQVVVKPEPEEPAAAVAPEVKSEPRKEETVNIPKKPEVDKKTKKQEAEKKTIVAYDLSPPPATVEKAIIQKQYGADLSGMLLRLSNEIQVSGLLIPTLQRKESEEIESFNNSYAANFMRIGFHIVSVKYFQSEKCYILDPLGESDVVWLNAAKFDNTTYQFKQNLTFIRIATKSNVLENLTSKSMLYLEGSPVISQKERQSADKNSIPVCTFEPSPFINKPRYAKKSSVPGVVENPLSRVYLSLEDVVIYIK